MITYLVHVLHGLNFKCDLKWSPFCLYKVPKLINLFAVYISREVKPIMRNEKLGHLCVNCVQSNVM